MLKKLHQCQWNKPPLHFPILSSLLFPKPSSSVSAAMLHHDHDHDHDQDHQLKTFAFGRFVGPAPRLYPPAELNRKISQFLLSHVLAGNRSFKDLHSLIYQIVQQEGSGSAPSICELLLNNFHGWDSNIVVWDMLAFAYSRFELVQDALFVLAKMKDLNLRASIQTYNSLLHNLRHTDIMWDVRNEIRDSGTPENEYTNSILIHGLCEQSRLQDAVSFLQISEGKDTGLSVVSFNTIMTRFHGRSLRVQK
nr:putative pentatricopeptide repeat-containing protein [Quercus suber]